MCFKTDFLPQWSKKAEVAVKITIFFDNTSDVSCINIRKPVLRKKISFKYRYDENIKLICETQ